MIKYKNVTALILFFSISIFFLSAVNSFALREIQTTTGEMARNSTDVVIATCVKSEVALDEDTGLIFTYTTFKVLESLKGEYGEEVVLRIVGGTVGEITMKSPNMPKFNPDEEVVLFLGPTNSKGYPVLKSIQNGVYKVYTDESGAKYLNTPMTGVDHAHAGENTTRNTDNNKIYLDDFIKDISQSM